jgi:threonine dehydrogenase-like Zn-dependent dehydrogenase
MESNTMRGAVIHGPRDVRFEERPTPKIEKPTDAVIRISAACVCGSDLWPYRGANPITQPTPMGHEYCGFVEEVGRDVIRSSRGTSRATSTSGTTRRGSSRS